MDLLSLLPSFPTKPYTHLLPSLERARLSTADLLALDTLELAKRAHLPPADVRRFAAHVTEALHVDLGFERDVQGNGDVSAPDSSVEFGGEGWVPGEGNRVDLNYEKSCGKKVISTLDERVDEVLGGGIGTGYLTEITGESGSGKTQLLLTLLLSGQLPSLTGGHQRPKTIYISTESALSTPRLTSLLTNHSALVSLPAPQKPSLENILSINAMDLEVQDHILTYQLPVAVRRHDVSLIVIDSITANFRAEQPASEVVGISARSGELARLGQLLRNLAAREDVAVVVANQVSDRFDDSTGSGGNPPAPVSATGAGPGTGTASPRRSILPNTSGGSADGDIPSSSPAVPYIPDDDLSPGTPARSDILSLLHQQRFFTGWGDLPQQQQQQPLLRQLNPWRQGPSLKTPALGLVWSTQIACRIALKREVCRVPSGDGDAIANGILSQSQSQSQSQSTPTPTPTPIPTQGQGQGQGQRFGESKRNEEYTLDTISSSRVIRRTLKLVMAPWTAGVVEGEDREGAGKRVRDEIDFEIGRDGLRSLP